MSQNQEYIPPEYEKEAFHCPMCNVFAHQSWYASKYELVTGVHHVHHVNYDLLMSMCSHCHKFSYWNNKKLIFPPQITAPLAHKDMPESVLEYYNEAREVSVSSNRAAAALLRIAAKKLCEELGESDVNLNKAIGNLSKKGLPKDVIKSLDTVRIIGNEGGAHEGQIDLSGEDNKQIVDRLFWLVNFIIEKTITEPKEVANAFASLPEDRQVATQKRDEARQ